MLLAGLSGPAAESVSNLTDLKHGDIQDGEAYSFEEVYVLAEYAVYSYDGNLQNYYLIGFEDVDGAICYASLQVDPDTPLGLQCEVFIEEAKDAEDDEEIDPLELTGVFSCDNVSELEDDLVSWYQDIYEEAVDELEYGTNTRMNFTYEAKDEAAYLKQQEESSIVMLIVGSVFIVGSGLGLFFLIRHRKKIKEMEANQMNFDGGYPGNMNGGYPGGYPGNVNGGYPGNANGGYPGNVDGGYPGANGGYPGANGGYPGNVNGGYPGNANGGYPGNANGGYPGNANGGYPGDNGGYNNPTGGQ